MKYIILFLLLASALWASPELDIISYEAKYKDFTYIQNPKITVYQVNKYKETMTKDFDKIKAILQEGDRYQLLLGDYQWKIKKIDERIEELKRKRTEFIIWVMILAGFVGIVEISLPK